MKVVPLSQYFVWSEGQNPQDFTAVEWLSRVDDKILDRIIKSSEKFFELEGSGEDEEFDTPFECLDYLTLCYIIGEKEANSDSNEFNEETRQGCLIGLAAFAQCEHLRRTGMLNFAGSGKIYEFHKDNTKVELTETGKMLGSSMQTLLEISEAAENLS
ncbi:MAG TPA: hypothetical protein VMW36_02960 [Patescibacteria group bacterium]|nr:hypothetical protein [Patescibacteria group bacterium]